MTFETQSNAEKRVRGFFRSGHDRLVDDNGVPIELKDWNRIKRMYSDKILPISNQGMSKVSNESVKVLREVAPIKKWAPAKKGANAKFSGVMSQDFPEVANLKEEQVDRIVDSLRQREIQE